MQGQSVIYRANNLPFFSNVGMFASKTVVPNNSQIAIKIYLIGIKIQNHVAFQTHEYLPLRCLGTSMSLYLIT